MNIIEALVQLRDDLKLWVTNNLIVKVDKEDGKGLSSNDFTDEEKAKLAAINTDATNVTVDDALSATSTNPVQNKVVYTEIDALKILVGDTPVSEQIENAKSLETTPDDIIAWMSEANVVTPLASASGEVYMTNDNKILIL